MPEREDFKRLETKVDRLTEAISKLVLIEERQLTQGQRIGTVEQRCTAIEVTQLAADRKLDQWINRGIGVWALAVTIFAIFKAFH